MASSILDDILTAAIVTAAVAFGQPELAWAALAKSFAVTLVLTEVSKFLAPNPPNVNSTLLSRSQSVRTPIGSRQIIYGQVRVGGELTYARVINVNFGTVFAGTPTNLSRTMNLVITLSGHEVQEIGDIWFDDEVIPVDSSGVVSGRLAQYAVVQKKLGTDDDVCFGTLLERTGAVSTTFRQRGCAAIYAGLSKNNDLYPNGIPNISAVVKGAKCYDPRTGLTVWTQNAALCINHYLCLPKKKGGLGCDYASEIDQSDLITAANICDEDVALLAGGTEKRYTLNGAFLVNADPKSVLQSMLSSMAGTLVCVGGVWHIKAGAYATPTVTLTESHARGPIRTQMRMSRAEVFNGVKGVYISPNNNWQPSDFTPITNATYLTEDAGERLWKDVQFQFTTSHATAQRLAKIELERSRQQITEIFPANLMGLQVQAGDTVYRNSTAKGWVSKPFEVTDCKFVVYNDAQGAPALGVDLTLRETASTVWDWNTGLETIVDPAPDSSLANPFSPDAPGIVAVTESLYETTGSAGVKSLAAVTLGVIDDGSNPDYQLNYRLSSASTWTVVPVTKDTTISLFDLAPGIYEFRARTFNSLGVPSAFSATLTKELLGLTAPPSDVSGFSVRALAGSAWVMLERHPDLDVIQGGRIILRWSPTAGASWNNASLLAADGWPGDSVLIPVPLYSGTYLAKARDSTGNLSQNAVSFEITDANLTGYVTLSTLTEDPTFAGVKSSTAVVGGGIQLAGASNVDSIADVDSVVNWDEEGGAAMSGEYDFNTTMNLGSSKTVRLFPNQRGTNSDIGNTVDDRPLTIDDWLDVDGAAVDDVETVLWVRTTTGDPAGAPTWGAWHELLGPADYTLWGAQFKLIFTSADQMHNRNVDQLSVAAKQ